MNDRSFPQRYPQGMENQLSIDLSTGCGKLLKYQQPMDNPVENTSKVIHRLFHTLWKKKRGRN